VCITVDVLQRNPRVAFLANTITTIPEWTGKKKGEGKGKWPDPPVFEGKQYRGRLFN
jgi:hypothetical protein